MILDIAQIIINYSKLDNQINCSQINKYFNNNLYVFYLAIKKSMNQQVIQQKIFSKLKMLNCYDNKEIYDVNHLKNTLKILICFGTCGIDQSGISDLRYIEKLCCDCNNKINNVNHLKNTLKILYCSENCGIDQNGISELQYVEELRCSKNNKIYDASHLKNTAWVEMKQTCLFHLYTENIILRWMLWHRSK